MLNWVTNRTSCSGRIWVSITLYSGWTTLKKATTDHTLDMSMWGAVRHRRTFSYDDCNMVQSIAIDHKYSPSTYRTKMPIHSGNGFFTEFWYDPQALATAHWLCDTFADFIAPVSFVLLSYINKMLCSFERHAQESCKERGNLKRAQGLRPHVHRGKSLPRSSLGSTTTASI